MDVLVLDIGGSHVKAYVSSSGETTRFESGQQFSPDQLVERVRAATGAWKYSAVSIGYPGTVDADGPTRDPGNLGRGWVGYDFADAFGVPVRVVNDAILQALGAYDGGRMLFLGLGTGLGSALITEHVVVPMELGDLVSESGETYGEVLGSKGLETAGRDRWLQAVHKAIHILRRALIADYTLLGGGNANLVDPTPPATRVGGNADAFAGGVKLWDEIVEPHDRRPFPSWRVVP